MCLDFFIVTLSTLEDAFDQIDFKIASHQPVAMATTVIKY